MIAEVTSDGNDPSVVQHWQLRYKGYFIADTSVPETASLFREMANRLEIADRLATEGMIP